MARKTKDPLNSVEMLALRLEALEKPEVRAAVMARLLPLLEKAPVVTLHTLCQQLEVLKDE